MLDRLSTYHKSFYVKATNRWWTVVLDDKRLVLVSRIDPTRVLRPVPDSWGNHHYNKCKWFAVYDPRYGSYGPASLGNNEYYAKECIPEWVGPGIVNWYKSSFTETMTLSEFLSRIGPEGSWDPVFNSPLCKDTSRSSFIGEESDL